jgi:hypothetical protein
MVIEFPKDPPNELVWSPEDNPYNLIFQYDSTTNSWQIVGPDNLATTDYVDSKILETGSDVIRNYDLHTNVNTVSIVGNYILNSTTSRLAVDSPNGVGDVFTCDQVFRDGVYGDTVIENPPLTLEASYAYQVPDWQQCQNRYVGAKEFEVVGYDEETTALSYKYKDIKTFLFNAHDINYSSVLQTGEEHDWLKDCNPGDTLEVNYIVEGGGGDPRYALYRVLDVIEYTEYSPKRYGVYVNFLASATPEVEFLNNPANTHYEFRNYLQPLNSSGGKLSGDLKIVSDSTSALSVWRIEDDFAERAFNVNTQTGEVIASRKLSEKITKTDEVSNQNTVATIGFVNNRLGIKDEGDTGYKTRPNGPYLQIIGGTMTGTLTINRKSGGGSGQFVLKGLVGTNQNSNVLNSFISSDGDSVRYHGRMVHDKDIVNVKHVKDNVTTINNNLAKKLSRGDGANANDNKMAVNLQMNNHFITGVKEPSNNNNDYAATVKFVKDRMSGKISNTYESDPGLLFDLNGVLYYNTY